MNIIVIKMMFLSCLYVYMSNTFIMCHVPYAPSVGQYKHVIKVGLN